MADAHFCITEANTTLQSNTVQFILSVVSECLWLHRSQATLFITKTWSMLKLMSKESVMPSNHLILCCPLLFLLSIFSSIRVYSKESVLCIRWPKYWSFSFSISPSNEYSGLIFFQFSSVQFSSVTQSCLTLRPNWTAARQASLSITNSRSSHKLTSIKSVMPSSHLILCHPLLLLPPIPPSIRVFSNESTLCMRWPKSCSLRLNNLQSNCSPWDSQESSPTPQFKSINFSVLSLLYGPTLTSIHK